MDEITNPFSPGAGSPPPELAGRDAVLEEARVLFGRVRLKKSGKSMLLTGLRGVGKTVLLNEIARIAKAANYEVCAVEAHEGKRLAQLLVPNLRRLLYDLDRIAGAGNKVRRGLAVLKSFISSIKVTVGDVGVGLDIEPEAGSADSGDLEADLSSLFEAVGEAAQERATAIAILIDEIQYFDSRELSALIMALHKMQQLQLPLVLIGAGLPILPGLVGDSKSYAERLFSFRDIGALPAEDSIRALEEPVEKLGVSFDSKALEEILRFTKGYPYFLQEWGYQAWNHATSSPISVDVIRESSDLVSKRLDKNFFRVRFDRLTPKEAKYLRAMAELGAGVQRTADVNKKMGVTKAAALGMVRDSLIKKGMVYSPAHGDIAFTVPLFDEFLRRAIPVFEP